MASFFIQRYGFEFLPAFMNPIGEEETGIITHYKGKPFSGIIFIFDHGQIQTEYEMLDGLKNGIAKEFDNNGSIKKTLYYIDNELMSFV